MPISPLQSTDSNPSIRRVLGDSSGPRYPVVLPEKYGLHTASPKKKGILSAGWSIHLNIYCNYIDKMNIFPHEEQKSTIIETTACSLTVRMLWFCPVPYFMFKELCPSMCSITLMHQCVSPVLGIFHANATADNPWTIQSYIPIGSISSCIFTWHEQLKSMVNVLGKHTIHGSYGMNPVPFSSQGFLRCLDFHRLSPHCTWRLVCCFTANH